MKWQQQFSVSKLFKSPGWVHFDAEKAPASDYTTQLHLSIIWGFSTIIQVQVLIQHVINDYNQWMTVIDLIDYWISY